MQADPPIKEATDAPADHEPPAGDAQNPHRSRTGVASAELARALSDDAAAVARRIKRELPSLRRRFVAALPDESRVAAALATVRHGVGRIGSRLGAGHWRLPTRRRWVAGVAVVFLCVFAAFGGVLIWALHDLPPGTSLGGSAEPSILLEASDGQPLSRKGPFKLADLPREAFPDRLVDAVIAIEDRRFYSHWGVDPRGMARALFRNVNAGEVVEGGSTITQQLVKILHLERDRTLKRKIREATLALWLEMRLGKDDILTRYLNNVYLGAGATGAAAAARIYFDKDVGDLTLAESALLAGLIKAPSQLNPMRDIQTARERAALVLAAMAGSGSVSDAEAKAAEAEPATLSPSRVTAHAGTWFADWAFKEAVEIAGAFRGTMRVRTTLVPQLQSLAEQVVGAALADAGEARGASQAALVALRPDGAVLAMVGGRSYADSEFNRAVDAMRQPGSTFKLFVYYAALRAGLSPRDRVDDSPIEVDGWEPENFGGRNFGRVSLAEAFARSLNNATVRLAMEVGLDNVVAAARDLGVDAALPETPSLALGAAEMNLLDLTGAYASVRGGVAPVEPWGISAFGSDEQPRLFALGPPVKPERDIREYQEPLVGMLKLVVDRGTGRRAALDGFAAGKTGTSQDYKDAWFVGFNEQLVVGVWVGNDDGTPMDEVTGGTLPASIWRDFMRGAMGLAAAPEGGEVAEADAEGEGGVEESRPPETASLQCNYRACARAYRSFRASDCTFQPYGGRRKLCER